MMIALAMLFALQQVASDVPTPDAYVTVQCVAGPNDVPQNCQVIDSTHPDQGFEPAAISVMQRGRVGQRQGVRVGQAYRVKVKFKLEQDAAARSAPSTNPERIPAS
jgi:hypothetical protein